MDESTRRPSYWAVLPASVRYDPDLSSTAKLLYAEISSLTESYGYCWASNDYFMRLYGFKSDKTVTRSLEALEKKGFIRLDGVGTTKRRIWCGINPLAGAGMENGPPVASAPTDKNVGATDKNVGATDKNVGATLDNKKIKQKRGTDPPKAPQGAGADFVPKEAPDWKPERFARFWAYFPLHKSKQAAIRAWDKLRPSDELIAVMGKALKRQKAEMEATGGEWKLYASTFLNGARWTDEAAAPQPSARGGLPPETDRKEAIIEWEN